MTYEDKAEVTREFYRKQGEERERKKIIEYLKQLSEHHPGERWTLPLLHTIIKQL
jgi:hypothetical protein